MGDRYTLYGARGTGSVAVEAALTVLELPFDARDVAGPAPPAESEVLSAVNPMRQLPALVLPSGEVMTESAAILIWLADSHPDAGLAPAPEDPRRPTFLRWMMFVSSAIYALFWVYDEPSRLSDDAPGQALIRQRIEERILHCWSVMEAQLAPEGPFLMGERLSVLDIYAAVVSRWEPGRRRIGEAAPRLMDVMRGVDTHAALTDLWDRRFPFRPGWEG